MTKDKKNSVYAILYCLRKKNLVSVQLFTFHVTIDTNNDV